jgi:hypothetical protein
MALLYIIDNRNSAKNDESIQGLNLMNQPIENLTKENTCRNMNYLDSINAKEIINNDKYQKLLSYFKANMPHFPYNNLSIQVANYRCTTSPSFLPSASFQSSHPLLGRPNTYPDAPVGLLNGMSC